MNTDVQGVVCKFCGHALYEVEIDGERFWAVEGMTHPLACPYKQPPLQLFGLHRPAPPKRATGPA